MEESDDPGWSWPAWKFDMKREDLTTTLHDRYNTFASTIQDAEAFHHDVCAIAHEAATTDEFHRLLAARRQQRLRELNDSLESAAFEIIGNPKLIGTDQWQHAIQLFRSRSLDSLVRYFSSYIPEHYFTRYDHGHRTPSSTASSFADYSSVKTESTNPSSVGGSAMIFADEDKSLMHEPENIDESSKETFSMHEPLSPRSMTTKMGTAASTPAECTTHTYISHLPSPARTLSLSEYESDGVPHPFSRHQDEMSQSEESDALTQSDDNLSDSRSSLDSVPCFSVSASWHGLAAQTDGVDDEEEFPTCQLPFDLDYEVYDNDLPPAQPSLYPSESMESETPTPRPEPQSSSYIDSKSIPPSKPQTPSRSSPPTSPKLRQRDRSPVQSIRRSPEETFSRIQKLCQDPTRSRPKVRRRPG